MRMPVITQHMCEWTLKDLLTAITFFSLTRWKNLSPGAMKIVYGFSFISLNEAQFFFCSPGSAEGLNKQDQDDT